MTIITHMANNIRAPTLLPTMMTSVLSLAELLSAAPASTVVPMEGVVVFAAGFGARVGFGTTAVAKVAPPSKRAVSAASKNVVADIGHGLSGSCTVMLLF